MSATPDIASIEFVHPESDLVVDRLLSVLEEKSPVQGFYHHLLDGLDSIRPGQTTPLGTVTHVLAWPSVSPIHARAGQHSPLRHHQHTHLPSNISAIQEEEEVETVAAATISVHQRNVDSVPTDIHLPIPESARFHTPPPPETVGLTIAASDAPVEVSRHVSDEVRLDSSDGGGEASSIEAIFNHEGKWEVLNEEELLADKETEHSKSGSSYSSSHGSQTEHPDTEADTTAAVMASQVAVVGAAATRGISQSSMSFYDLRSSSPLIAEGYRHFPSVYTAFVLSVPPSRLQTLLQLQQEPGVTFHEILSLSNQLYCNPHLLQGLMTYLQVNMPFREWCSKLVTSSVIGGGHSSAHTVGVIASTLSPELLPQVETGTPHHMPIPRPVSPRDLITTQPPPTAAVVSPPQSVLSVATHAYHDRKAFNSSTQGLASPTASGHQQAPAVQLVSSQQVGPSITYIPVQVRKSNNMTKLSRRGDEETQDLVETPEMIPTPRAGVSSLEQPRHNRIKMADSKLLSIHGVHKSPLSPSCRVIEIFPNHVVTHTAANSQEAQTTIVRTGGVTVATTIEVSDTDMHQGNVAATTTTTRQLDAARNSFHIPNINSSEALMIDQVVGGQQNRSQQQQPVPLVTTPLPHSPIESSVLLEGGSPIAVTAVTSYFDEWQKLSAGFIAPPAAVSQICMLSPQVLEETLRVLEPSLRERVTEIETETQRRLELLYSTGHLPIGGDGEEGGRTESQPRMTLFIPQTSRTMSPRNILRLVATEIAFMHTVRRFVKRVLKSVELGTSTAPSNGVVAMLSAQLASQKRDFPQQLENFIESNLSRTLSHSVITGVVPPQYAGLPTSIASTQGNSILHYDIRSTAQHSSIPLIEPMVSYVRPTYDHHATHSFGGSHLDIKDMSVVASEWRMDSRITSR